MATAVGLNFKMTASIAKFQASMDKVESKLKAIEGSSRQTAKGMKLLAALEIGKSVLSGLTGLFNIFKGGIDSVMSFSSEAAAAADAIGKLSSSTGMAHEPLQVFTQMAAYGGVSSTQFGDALQKMSRGLGEAANGTGTAGKALERMGLSLDGLLQMSPDEQFLAIGSAIGEIEDPALRSQAAADIFGRSGTKLIPMFENLEENARATADEMLELGQVLSVTQVRNIEAMNDSFEKVKQTAFSIGSQVLANFAPALTKANEALISLIKNFEYEGATGGQGLANYLTTQLFSFAKTFAQILDKFIPQFADAVGLLLQGLGKIITDGLTPLAALMGADFETLEEIEWAGRQIGMFGKKLKDTESNLESLVDNGIAAFDKASNEAADNLDGFASGAQTATDPLKLFGEENGIAGEALRQLALEAEKFGPNADLAREALDGIKNAAANATDPIDLFGKENGLAGEKLRQLASDAEKFGPNAELARQALDAMKGASDRATSGVELFGRDTGVAGGGLRALALEEEARRATSERLRDEETKRIRGHLGIWDRTADKMMAFWQRLGVNPEWLQKRRAAERQAYETNLKAFYEAKTKREEEIAARIKAREDKRKEREDKLYSAAYKRAEERKKLQEQARKDYEAITNFGKSLNEWFSGNDGEGPEFPEGETTLPELQTQTSTLGSILTAVQDFGKNFVTATIPG